MGIVLTVVVPAYNVEGYLPKCIDSILAQDLFDEICEIIIVDDGSTDKSGKIADDYASSHANIKVIHQSNGGLSAARNAGISAARGKYIQFVDSDDYLEQRVLAQLVNKMEAEELDVLRFNYRNVDEKYEPFVPNKEDKLYVDYRDELCDGPTFLTERLGFACYACQFIIRTCLLMDNEILFKEGIYFEDTDWTPRMLSVARRVTSVDTIVYNYYYRIGSITKATSLEKEKKLVSDRLRLVKSFSEQALHVTDRRWYDGMISVTVISLLNAVCCSAELDSKYYLSELKAMHIFPLSFYHQTAKARRKVKLINMSPALFCMIYKLKNS